MPSAPIAEAYQTWNPCSKSFVWGGVYSAESFNPTLRSSLQHRVATKALAQTEDASAYKAKLF